VFLDAALDLRVAKQELHNKSVVPGRPEYFPNLPLDANAAYVIYYIETFGVACRPPAEMPARKSRE